MAPAQCPTDPMTTAPHYLALPKSGAGPGVLVLHSWWGLNPFFKGLCDRLARAGFVALAPDLYAGRVATTPAQAKALRAEATAKRRTPAYKLLIAAIEELRNHEAVQGSRIAVLGFSMGGHWALWLAQRPELPIAATVVFYAARNGDYSRSRSRFLIHFAASDDWVSAASARKLEASLAKAKVDATYWTYPGTPHWFFESDRKDADDRPAAASAWKRTVAFLNEV